MLQTRVVVIEPNGVQRTMPLTARGLSIGRGPENDLTINYPTTSRHHARISFDGVNFFVTDLNSGNGTFMGNDRLIPEQPYVWSMGVPLQIGDVVLQLEQGQFQPQTMPQPSGQAARGERQSTDTIVGWVPDQNQKKGPNRMWLVLLILVILVCVCAVLGAGSYFIFLGS